MHRLKSFAPLLFLTTLTSAPPVSAAPPAWLDAPVAAGEWSYRGDAQDSAAFFGVRSTPPQLAIRCDRRNRLIRLDRRLPAPATAPATIGIRTSYGETQRPAGAIDPAQPLLSARLRATDPTLDEIAFSRGRFMITASGASPLIVPARPEVARVIEDCRG
ncbi:MAG: hypothetical protein AB7S92_26385 [Parvibaculaceae bacterium]